MVEKKKNSSVFQVLLIYKLNTDQSVCSVNRQAGQQGSYFFQTGFFSTEEDKFVINSFYQWYIFKQMINQQ